MSQMMSRAYDPAAEPVRIDLAEWLEESALAALIYKVERDVLSRAMLEKFGDRYRIEVSQSGLGSAELVAYDNNYPADEIVTLVTYLIAGLFYDTNAYKTHWGVATRRNAMHKSAPPPVQKPAPKPVQKPVQTPVQTPAQKPAHTPAQTPGLDTKDAPWEDTWTTDADAKAWLDDEAEWDKAEKAAMAAQRAAEKAEAAAKAAAAKDAAERELAVIAGDTRALLVLVRRRQALRAVKKAGLIAAGAIAICAVYKYASR